MALKDSVKGVVKEYTGGITQLREGWAEEDAKAALKKREKDFRLLEKVPEDAREHIADTKATSVSIAATLSIVVISSLANVSHALHRHGLELLAFWLGVFLASKIVFGGAHLMNMRRWRCYWHGSLLGYFVAHLLLIFLPPLFGLVTPYSYAAATEPGHLRLLQTPSVVRDLLTLAVLTGPPLAAVLVGILNLRRNERRNRLYVQTVYVEWKKQKQSEQIAEQAESTVPSEAAPSAPSDVR